MKVLHKGLPSAEHNDEHLQNADAYSCSVRYSWLTMSGGNQGILSILSLLCSAVNAYLPAFLRGS